MSEGWEGPSLVFLKPREAKWLTAWRVEADPTRMGTSQCSAWHSFGINPICTLFIFLHPLYLTVDLDLLTLNAFCIPKALTLCI